MTACDTGVKRELLATLDKSKILFVVEDRSRVVEMCAQKVWSVLQCAPGSSSSVFSWNAGLRVAPGKTFTFPCRRILSEKETRVSASRTLMPTHIEWRMIWR